MHIQFPDNRIADNLYAIAHSLIRKHDYEWPAQFSKHDIIQENVKYGFCVYKETRNVRFAAKRMESRLIDAIVKASTSKKRESHISFQRNRLYAKDNPADIVAIEDFINSLPGNNGQVIRLRLKGHTIKEIAQITRISRCSVNRILHQVREQLKRLINE